MVFNPRDRLFTSDWFNLHLSFPTSPVVSALFYTVIKKNERTVVKKCSVFVACAAIFYCVRVFGLISPAVLNITGKNRKQQPELTTGCRLCEPAQIYLVCFVEKPFALCKLGLNGCNCPPSHAAHPAVRIPTCVYIFKKNP